MRNVPKFVLQRLQETSPAADSHPDADLLTAFAEQSLADRERALVMEHLALCGDCRDVVTLALPAMESVALLPAASPARIGWLGWPALRWAAVAAGILAVTSIGVLQYNHRNQVKTVASNLMPTEAASATPAFKQTTPAPATLPQRETRREFFAEQKPAAVAGLLAAPAPSRAKTTGGVGGGVGMGSGSGSGQAVLDQRDSSLKQAAEKPLPVQPQAPTPEIHQEVVVGRASETVEVEAAAGQVKTESASEGAQNQLAQNQSNLPLQGRAFTDLDVVKAKDAVPGQVAAGSASVPALAPPTVPLQTSPTLMARASPRWTVSSAGVLQRSFDAGKTWEDVNPALNPAFVAGRAAAEVTADQSGADKSDKNADKKLQKAAAPPNLSPVFHAVAAIGLEVWAGGSGGVVYHSTDGGNRWARVVPSAAGTTLTGDILGIQFLDPQHGRIATSSGELWTTSDAGQSWQRQLRP